MSFLSEMRLQIERLNGRDRPSRSLPPGCGPFARGNLSRRDLGEIAVSPAGSSAASAAGASTGSRRTPRQARSLSPTRSVRQIGRILVENAILHTPAGTEIRLSTADTDDGVELQAEHWAGILPDDSGATARCFYRAGSAVSSGSGLGLAIARELAGVMGGEIGLTRPGRTLLTLKLPRSHVPVEEPEHALAR